MATRSEAAKKRARHPERGTFVKQRTNGHTNEPTMATPIGLSRDLERMLRPQAAFRWILPNIAAITPQYIEMVMRGALAGNHVQQWELFDLMMDTWPELSACFQELSFGVLSKKLVFEPFHEEDEAPDQEALDRMKLVSEALRGMQPEADRDENSLSGTIQDLLDGWLRGITVQEILWQPLETDDAGTIIAPKSTFWVHPVAYGFNANGVLGLRTVGPESLGGISPARKNLNYPNIQTYPYSYLAAQPQPAILETFPDHKFLIGIHKSKPGTALGGPLLRPLAWWWVAANFSADWLLNLAQLFGIPFRYANYPVNAAPDTIDAIQKMLQSMGSAGWAAFPEGTSMEFQETGAGRQAEYSPQGTLMDRADRYARLLVLGQTMTGNTMTSGKGGQAFGVVEQDVKQERIDAAGKFCCDVINKQLIRSILLLNYGDDSYMPTIRLLEENEGQYQDAQRDQILIKSGLKVGVDFMRKKYGIPEPAEDEETLGGQPTPEPGVPTDTGLPNQFTAPGTGELDDEAMQSASGAYALGHQFYGNQWTSTHGKIWDGMSHEDRFDLLKKHHPFDALVTPKPFREFANKSAGDLSKLEKAKVVHMLKSERMRQQFPSITHSAEEQRRLMRNAGIITKQGDTANIYILRHGCTELNGDKDGQSPDIVRGHKDVPLTPKGKAQARDLAEHLSDKGIKTIFTSDLSRASDTAQIIADKLPETPRVIDLKGLRPWALGKHIEGKPSAEVADKINHYVDNPDEQPDDGETFNDFSGRFQKTLHHIKNDYGHQNIAVVTHYRGIKMIQATKGGDSELDPEEFKRREDGQPPGSYFKLGESEI